MRLPGGEQAIIAPGKLRAYLLSPSHRDGSNKARVFASALGLRGAQADILEVALKQAAAEEKAEFQRHTEYGPVYLVRFKMQHQGRSAIIRSVWIIPNGRSRPELVTAIVE